MKLVLIFKFRHQYSEMKFIKLFLIRQMSTLLVFNLQTNKITNVNNDKQLFVQLLL